MPSLPDKKWTWTVPVGTEVRNIPLVVGGSGMSQLDRLKAMLVFWRILQGKTTGFRFKDWKTTDDA
jgi:hypothetical protein